MTEKMVTQCREVVLNKAANLSVPPATFIIIIQHSVIIIEKANLKKFRIIIVSCIPFTLKFA